MENGSRGVSCRRAICTIVAVLGATAFACSLAAEFRKVEGKDMKVDGSLCSLPRSSAFELGVAAVALLFVAQIVGTTAAVTGAAKPKKTATARGRVVFIGLLVLSWVSFAVAVILLATAASMNKGQRYGRGWMDGDCYVARTGVFGGAAALVLVTAVITLGLAYSTDSPSSSATSAPVAASRAAAPPAAISLDAEEQPGGRS